MSAVRMRLAASGPHGHAHRFPLGRGIPPRSPTRSESRATRLTRSDGRSGLREGAHPPHFRQRPQHRIDEVSPLVGPAQWTHHSGRTAVAPKHTATNGDADGDSHLHEVSVAGMCIRDTHPMTAGEELLRTSPTMVSSFRARQVCRRRAARHGYATPDVASMRFCVRRHHREIHAH